MTQNSTQSNNENRNNLRLGVLLFFGPVLVAFASPFLGLGSLIQESENAADYIVSVFSILSASLFAVISIVGDPSMLLRGGWRSAWRSAQSIQARLQRLTYLFLLHLLTLSLLLVADLIETAALEEYYWIYEVLAYFAILSLLYSLWLPFEIKSIQTLRLQQEIRVRKENGGAASQNTIV